MWRNCRAAPSIPSSSASETAQLFADYNRDHDVTPELDARFAALAAQRIHSAPLRYYLWLPALRIADMWLRPRTELLPSDPRWWEFNDERGWLAVSIVFGVVNLAYVIAAAAGLCAGAHIFRNRTARLISRAALAVPRLAGESRTSLHAGMLSRGHSLGLSHLHREIASHPIENPHKQASKSGTAYVKSCIQTFRSTIMFEDSACPLWPRSCTIAPHQVPRVSHPRLTSWANTTECKPPRHGGDSTCVQALV